MDYQPYAPHPTLRLRLPATTTTAAAAAHGQGEILFAIRPWHTVATLGQAIAEEDGRTAGVSLWRTGDRPKGAPSTAGATSTTTSTSSTSASFYEDVTSTAHTAKWSGPSPVEDVLRAGLREDAATGRPMGFLLSYLENVEGGAQEKRWLAVDMPTLSGACVLYSRYTCAHTY